MKSENVKEYELVRQEMITVKECITKYIGFVFGGTGLAVYGMIAIGHSKITLYEIAFTCFILSIIISFVLLILYYKFYSHNRFAGYCKLLNHEWYASVSSRPNTSLFAWEIAIERLRASDTNQNNLLNVLNDIEVKDLNIIKLTSLLKDYTGKSPYVDRRKFFKGLKVLYNAFLGKIRTRSWGFPPMVVSMFFIIVFGFLVGGFYATTEIYSLPGEINKEKGIIYLVALIVTIVQLLLWRSFVGKLYTLMNGSATVDAFFWRFLPVRAQFLNNLSIEPQYLFANERLADTTQEMGRQNVNQSYGQPE